MIRSLGMFLLIAQLSSLVVVEAVKQQLQLSNSYLPVAMQVIAHLTDQMAYETDDLPATTKKPVTSKPSTSKPSTSNPFSTSRPSLSPINWTKPPLDWTTPFHKPGLYAPIFPPKPNSYRHEVRNQGLLPPYEQDEYGVIRPLASKNEEPLLSIQQEEIKPLVDTTPNSHLLPPKYESDIDKISRSDDYSEENLQYLSPNVREMIRMAYDPDDERVVDMWETRGGGLEAVPKGKMSSSQLRLLLLYDLLSREAKRQRLSDYTGFSPDVMQTLVESSSGGARSQLSLALSKMVDRKDCEHEYANNRAKEMVQELGKDESKLSSELRYLQPLVYKF